MALLVSALVVAVVAGLRGTWSPCGLSMLSAINPVSEAGRGHRYGLTCAWFVSGAVAGGLLLGMVAAVLGVPARLLDATAVTTAAAALALVTLASDLRVGGWSLPRHPRQVDESWLGGYRRWVYAVGFGAQIGAGLATYVMTAATYLLVALAALTGSAAEALAVGAVFGLVRGLAVLLSATSRTPEDLRALHRRLAAAEPWSLRLAMVVQAAVAVGLAGLGGGASGSLLALVAAVGLALVGRYQERPAGQSLPHAVQPAPRDV